MLVRILKYDSIEKRNLQAVGGMSTRAVAKQNAEAASSDSSSAVGSKEPPASKAKDAKDPHADITPAFIQRILRIGSCAGQSTYLKQYMQRYNQMTRSMINWIRAYELLLEDFCLIYDAPDYETALERHGMRLTTLPYSQTFIERGRKLLGLLNRGMFPCNSQAMYYQPEGKNDSLIYGFRYFLGKNYIKGNAKPPSFEPRKKGRRWIVWRFYDEGVMAFL